MEPRAVVHHGDHFARYDVTGHKRSRAVSRDVLCAERVDVERDSARVGGGGDKVVHRARNVGDKGRGQRSGQRVGSGHRNEGRAVALNLGNRSSVRSSRARGKVRDLEPAHRDVGRRRGLPVLGDTGR